MGQAHFDSKWQIEKYVQSIGLPYTILRPVLFMDNYNWQRAAITNGVFTGMGLNPEKTVQMIAADDIGAFAALVFSDPQQLPGQDHRAGGRRTHRAADCRNLCRVIGARSG